MQAAEPRLWHPTILRAQACMRTVRAAERERRNEVGSAMSETDCRSPSEDRGATTFDAATVTKETPESACAVWLSICQSGDSAETVFSNRQARHATGPNTTVRVPPDTEPVIDRSRIPPDTGHPHTRGSPCLDIAVRLLRLDSRLLHRPLVITALPARTPRNPPQQGASSNPPRARRRGRCSRRRKFNPCCLRADRSRFPSPYITQGVRLTNDTDCGGQDCVNYVGYSYWRNINNHVGSNTMYVCSDAGSLAGRRRSDAFQLQQDDARGHQGRTALRRVERAQLGVRRRLVLQRDAAACAVSQRRVARSSGTTSSPRRSQTVFDVSSDRISSARNRYVWQLHSSNDDRVHSGTCTRQDLVRDARLLCLSRGYEAVLLLSADRRTSTSARSTRAADGW